MDVARSAGPGYVTGDDLRVEQGWPRFACHAVDHGYRAVICTELVTARGPEGPRGR